MLDFFTGSMTPRELLVLIDRLPRTSALADVMAQDDELAEGVVVEPSSGAHRVSLTEFPPEVEALAAVVDRLGEVVAAVVASAGGKARRVRPWPRPVTAADRARARAVSAATDDLERQLFPD